MKKILFSSVLIILILSGCTKYKKYEGVAFTEKEPRDWENPLLPGLNREDPHATMISFADEASALTGIKENSPNYLSLDGIWRFHFPKLRKSARSGSLRMTMISETGQMQMFRQTGSSREPTIHLFIQIYLIRLKRILRRSLMK